MIDSRRASFPALPIDGRGKGALAIGREVAFGAGCDKRRRALNATMIDTVD